MKKNYLTLGLTLMTLSVPLYRSIDDATQREYTNMSSSNQTPRSQPVVANQYSVPHVTNVLVPTTPLFTPDLRSSHANIVRENNQLYKKVTTGLTLLTGIGFCAYSSRKKN